MSRPASAPPVLPGFEFLRPLGTGGFSDVYLYQQLLPRRQVAVKVLLNDGLDPAARKAFIDEANVMAQLSAHPYIVAIHHADIGPGDKPFIVMEYCSGPSLSSRYKMEPFDVDDALRIGVRLAGAIATAHSVGILHRDIKPANVLTNDFGWPALTDFGISSTLEDDLPTHTTTMTAGDFDTGSSASQSVGMSIPWSPPEMFEDSPQPDVRSDIFSLAATIYTLLAGRTPFELTGRGNGALDLIGRIERGAITPMDRTDVPRSFIAVLQKGMAVNRADRYSTAVEFARALQRVELELGYSPTGIEVPNLAIASERPDDTGSDDETRIRPMSTIAAQPVAPVIDAIPVPPTADQEPLLVSPSAPVSEETVVRQRAEPALEQPAVATPVVAAEPEPSAPASKRGLVVGLISAVAGLSIVAIVIASVLSSGAFETSPVGTTSSTPSGGSAVIGGVVPKPVDGVADPSADGTTVTFSWTNPDEQPGDGYRYARSETPNDRLPLEDAFVTIDGVTPGSTVCIDAYIVRGGQLSADPLTVCYPEL